MATIRLLEKQRSTLRGGVTRACNILKDELEKATVINEQSLSDAIAQLDAKEPKLEDMDNQILRLIQDEDQLDHELAENEKYSERLVHWRARAKKYLEEKRGPADSGRLRTVESSSSIEAESGRSSRNGQEPGTTLRLPKLEIKKFDGNVDKWQAFWTQFEGAIHNNPQLNATDKFNYLKSYLKGAAEAEIDGLSLNEQNYLGAIEILTNRFGGKETQASDRLNAFLKMSPIQKSTDVAGLKNLLVTCEIEVRNLKSQGQWTDSYGELFARIVGGLFPLDLLENYTRHKEEKDLWKIDEVIKFLSTEIKCRERALAVHRSGLQQSVKTNVNIEKPISRSVQQNVKNYTSKPFSAAALNTGVHDRVSSGYQRKCEFCENPDHFYYECKEIPITERRAIARQKKLCFLCLKPGHNSFQCRGRVQGCRKCHKRHHQSLCDQGDDKQVSNTNSMPISNVQNNARSDNQIVGQTEVRDSATLATGSAESSVVLLQTARAFINDKSGNNVSVRCVLDGASHRSFIKEEISRKLQLEVVGTERMTLFPFESTVPIQSTRRKVKVELKNIKTGEMVEIIALETPSINGAVFAVPGEKVREEMKNRNLELADLFSQEKEGTHSPIEVLIGADFFWRVVNGEMERLSPDLMAMNTVLGWTVQGRSEGEGGNTGVNTIAVIHVAVPSEETLVSEQLKDFWNLESLGIHDSKQTKVNEHEAVLETFEKNIEFKEGRYQVTLPWKPNRDMMGDNYEVAKRRTINLVKKLEMNPKHLEEYDKIIEEQLRTGIIERVENVESSTEPNPCYYIPHRGVIRENRETTKLRIVNDASSHAKDSPSLNDCMDSGPNLLPELFKILVRFRQHKVAVIGDVEKAFHQISIVESDRDALRFFWVKGIKGNERNEMVVYRFTRIPFGCTASPFLLAATIKHHAKKYSVSHPLAYGVLKRDIYVDDLVTGGQRVEDVDQLIQQATQILGEAGMNLRKFHSNSKEIRAKWGEKSEGSVKPNHTKVLGLSWDEEKDTFSYDVSELLEFLLTRTNTKRWVLKAVARIFDPLGLLAPFLIGAKLLFQEMWRKGLAWDEPLENELAQKFEAWCSELPLLPKIEIPRCYFVNAPYKGECVVELHGFVDASNKAYAAVVYLRSLYPNSESHTTMVACKTRVSPIEKLSLPRLELMGGVLGARLMKNVIETLDIVPRSIHMWTDSTIVLHWIRDNSSRWKPFVSNRVKEIQGLVDPSCWGHVAGKENPADLPSRGTTLDELGKSQLWLQGPVWLSEGDKPEVELELVDEEIPEIVVEKKAKPEANLAIVMKTSVPILSLEKYSSAGLAFRVTAWVRRYILNLKRVSKNEEKVIGPLTTDELNLAEKYWIRLAQEESYPEEINCLSSGIGISKNSKIVTLSPIMDKEGLLRVGGRLDAANISYQEKHPWILSHKNKLTELMIEDCHVKLKHAGIDDVLIELREKFWINKIRRLIKSKIHKCPKCKRFRAKAPVAVMAPLPSARINPSPPFTVTGIDFAGPLFTRNGNKCYIALYTCAVTRALHLELVSDLSTDKFLLSFRRFIARRGIVHVIYSDNAKTFKKAEVDLNELVKNVRHSDVLEYFGSLRIEWRYIADRASWWGGFWERMVKSVKSSLRKTLGKARLSFEELETLLIEIEATINSRPISYVYDGPGEPTPLSPAHFLIGRRLTSLPSRTFSSNENMTATKEELTKRLKYRQTLLDRFWFQWKHNYLLELRSAHHRPACTPNDSLKIDDVVLIEDSKLPRLMWKLAVVEETMVGRDGVVRSCMVRLPNGNRIRRPIQLLYPLEI